MKWIFETLKGLVGNTTNKTRSNERNNMLIALFGKVEQHNHYHYHCDKETEQIATDSMDTTVDGQPNFNPDQVDMPTEPGTDKTE